MRDAYNFCAGPAALPEAVMRQAQAEFLAYGDERASIMEVSHRGAAFTAIVEKAEQDLKDLLNIPDNYHVLFMHGGATAQFFAVPMNLLGNKTTADYIHTGLWSKKALEEGKRYTDAHCVTSLSEAIPLAIPDASTWSFSKDPAYVHYADNETITGVEFSSIPVVPEGVPLICDMSSNFLSRAFDVSRFGLIYAGAQKNVGPSGMAVVIIRDDLLNRALAITPTIYRYALQAKAHSCVNTPSTFSIYLAGLCFQWLKDQGGIAAMEAINRQKAQKIYAAIDQHPETYRNEIAIPNRSRMNVTFKCKTEALDKQFVTEAAKQGLINLAGHREYGGQRASLYNAIPLAGVDALAAFMIDFANQHER